MNDTFIGFVVGVGKERAPFWIGWLVSVDGKSMVLRGNEATTCAFVGTRLVDTAVTIFHLKSREPGMGLVLVESMRRSWVIVSAH